MARTPASVFTEFIESINRRDLRTAMSLVTDDITQQRPISAPPARGREMVRVAIEDAFVRMPDLRFDMEVIAADGDRVVYEGVNRFTVAGEQTEVAELGWALVRDGKLAFVRAYLERPY